MVNQTRQIAGNQCKMQAYAMKIDLLSNATVIEKAVQFVDSHRGSYPLVMMYDRLLTYLMTDQNNRVRLIMTLRNLSKILDGYHQRLDVQM